MKDWKKKKMAVYLRRSEGETGSTQSQYDRIKKRLAELERKGIIAKLDRGVVGRDITGKRRFKAERDLALSGSIFNEGEGASGFKFEQRPVFVELLSRMKEGQYDGIIVESMNRIARDFAGLSHLALPAWREDGKVILSLTDNQILSDNRTNEAIINSQMTWGGIGKLEEIGKAKAALRDAIDYGYLAGSTPEFLGAATKSHGLDYRKAWKLMNAFGENDRGNLEKPTTVGKEFDKDNKWASLWYKKMKGFEQAGVLEDWLSGIEAVNLFIANLGGYARNQFKSPHVKQLLKSTRGYFGYPAGVNLSGSDEFVMFPTPTDIGIETLAYNKVEDIPGFKVNRGKVGTREILDIMTQPRARGKL